jgi:kumamolisin
VALGLAAVLFFLQTPGQAQTALTHHVRPAVTGGQARRLSSMSATESLRLHIVLPLRDQAGLDKLLRELADPASPNYRHFLTVSEFTAQFGPRQEDYEALTRYAVSNGFQIVGGSRDGMDLQIEGPVSAIETAFHVSMGVYQHPTENRTFYAPDREPTVGLPFPLWHVSGLDNYSNPHPLFVRKSDYARAHGMEPVALVSHATTGSGPSASFLGSDMRAAYYGGTALTGAGQNLGLFEFQGTDLADLTTYYTNTGQTNKVPITLLSTDGTSTSCVDSGRHGCDDTEQTLDMIQALGMAPGLASLVVYIGSTDTAIISAMTTHNPLPTTISCSWGWTPADASTLNPYFQKMAAQGQNFFVASGDASTWSASNEAWPADNAYVVSVGGTDLVTAGAGGAWSSETAWSDSGGGISPDKIAIPAWQQLSGVINSSNKGSTTYRNGPDVSANANFTFYVCANQAGCTANEYGGTSFAAPIWAGYMALVNQQAVSNGNATLGFINPSLYSFGTGSGYSTDFHDITSGTSGSYSAVTGYDLVTGWGSPNGTGLIGALAGLSSTPNFILSASPTSVSVAPGSSGTSTISTSVSGGFNSAVALSATGQPTGVTVTFTPSSIAAPGSGSSTMGLALSSTVAAGTYSITVTGTGGGLTHTATVTLTVPTPAFTIAASPTSVSIAQGAKGTSTITTTVSGGFNSAVTLSASGLPTGATAAFSPASIAAPGSGSSTLTLTMGASTPAGTYSVVVSGTGSGQTHTATVTLTVPVPAFTIAASPTSVSAAPGGKGTSTITTTVSNGFNAAVSLSASGLPTGTTAAFSPASIAAPGSGSSTLTLTVGSTTPVGVYSVVVTGTGNGTSHTATVTLTVTGPTFAIAASPGTVIVVQGSKGTSTISATIAGGFNSAVALSASGLPTGTTAAFNPTSIAAPGSGSSTLTFTVGSSTPSGLYTVTVTGTAGGVSHTANVSLLVETARP